MALERRGAAAMGLTAAASGFLVVLLCVPGLLAQCTSNAICALKGSTMNVSCTNDHPKNLDKRFWFRDGSIRDIRDYPEYAGRVEYICGDSNSSTLGITDLRESDGGHYGFIMTTKNPVSKDIGHGFSLTVTGLTVQWKEIYDDSSSKKRADLVCQTSCELPNNPTFIWYKNGEKIREDRSPQANNIHYEDGDSVVCAVKGHEDHHSPPLCLGGGACNRVNYTERNICAFKGSSINISCTYDSYGSVVSKFWFRPGHGPPSQPEDLRDDPQYEGRVRVIEGKGGRSTLRITELRESDADQYRFKFTTSSSEWRSNLPGPTLTVTDVQMLMTRTNVGPSETEAELKCVSSCSPAGPVSFVWIKNGQWQQKGETFSGRFLPGDEIFCALDGHEDYRSPSLYAPEVPSVNVSVSPDDIIEGRPVTLSCGGNGDTVKISWHKKDGNGKIRAVGEEPQLVFESIKLLDSGEYNCRAESQLGSRSSEFISVEVKYPPRLPSVSMVPSGDIVEGSTVTLICSSDANPAANYSWFEENQKLSETYSYTFSSIRAEDKGTYGCKSENSVGTGSASVVIDVLYPPRRLSVSVVPSGGITVGSTVTVTCNSDANPAANYSWFKKNEGSPRASGHTYVINNFTADHVGDYSCEATNNRGSQRVGFSLPLVSDTWIPIVGGTAAFTVSLGAILVAVFIWIRRKRQTPNRTRKRRARTQMDRVRYTFNRFFKRKETHNRATTGLRTFQQQREDGVGYASGQSSAGYSAPSNRWNHGGKHKRNTSVGGPSTAV